MNRTDWIQTGGVPLKAERMDEVQKAYSIFNHLGNIAGNLTILSGCDVAGTNVTDGVVFIDGEVIDFKGSTLSASVIITESTVSKEFKNGELKPLHYKRQAQFGTGTGSYAWADFVRLDPIASLMLRLNELEKKSAVFQEGGGMVLWNKPALDIPAGWVEVVNWRGRMPVGYDVTQTEFNTMGKQGGSKTHTLSISQLPIVTPEVNTGFRKGSTLGGAIGVTRNDYDGGAYAPGEIIKPFGGNQPHPILNPYRTVLFIEYIG